MFLVDGFFCMNYFFPRAGFLQNHPTPLLNSKVQCSDPPLSCVVCNLVENFLAKGAVIVNDSA